MTNSKILTALTSFCPLFLYSTEKATVKSAIMQTLPLESFTSNEEEACKKPDKNKKMVNLMSHKFAFLISKRQLCTTAHFVSTT